MSFSGDRSSAALQARVTELELLLVEHQQTKLALQRVMRDYQRLAAAINHVSTGVVISDPHQPDHPLIFVNPGFVAMTGYSTAEVVGRNCRFLQGPDTDPAAIAQLRAAIRAGRPCTQTLLNYTKDGTPFWNELTVSPVLDDDGQLINFIGLQTDVTARVRAVEEQARLQEQVIEAQASVLAELSTPLLPINDHVVVMPLVGSIDTRRAEQVVETLLHGVATHRARVAILDITAVPVIDTSVANALLRAATAIRLLGAEAILTGVRPEVAQTLVQLGVDLSTIVTRSSLQSGIAFALERR
jgi:rsbT co-antagonist protein RsbR